VKYIRLKKHKTVKYFKNSHYPIWVHWQSTGQSTGHGYLK